MEGLRNLIRQEVERAVSRRKHRRFGVVDSWDPNKHAVKVRFQPGNILSGWLPIGSKWAGKNYGLAIGLTAGEQVSVTYEVGDIGSAVVESAHWGDDDTPLSVQSGEAMMQAKDGQGFKLAQDKSLSLFGTTTNQAKVLFDPSGNIVATIQGSNQAQFKATGSLKPVKLSDGSNSNVLFATS